jgi:hypothetical protein
LNRNPLRWAISYNIVYAAEKEKVNIHEYMPRKS